MNWYVVQTHANSERKAVWHLQRQGFTVYLPCYLKRWKHARKTEMRPVPLFPRYVFVAMDIAQGSWRPIQSTIGVSCLVCAGNRPTPVPPGIVEGIKAREDENGLVSLSAAKAFSKGDALTVVEGGLSGANGFFECFDDQNRIVLLLELLGRPLRVHMQAGAVAVATA